MPPTTPSQTVGPFFAVGLPWSEGPYVVAEGSEGAIRIGGRVVDGEGEPVPDALVETWQADPEGRFDHPDDPRGRVPGFRGFGRCPTDDDGRWWVLTRKPGRVDDEQAPHIAVSILARGLLHRLVTRIYFADEPAANAHDPVLTALSEADRATLIATPAAGGYAIDFRLQGDGETVFFGI
jgi:protocatechuate 3,4-dioxygenase alpha subunit